VNTSTSLARRLRIVGTTVLVVGLVAAGLLYAIKARSAGPTMDDLMPGYSERRARTNSIIMGNMVVTLMGWAEGLKDPATQAIVIALASILIAWICFRVASLAEAPIDNGQSDVKP
jgi:hypothetical protein